MIPLNEQLMNELYSIVSLSYFIKSMNFRVEPNQKEKYRDELNLSFLIMKSNPVDLFYTGIIIDSMTKWNIIEY